MSKYILSELRSAGSVIPQTLSEVDPIPELSTGPGSPPDPDILFTPNQVQEFT